MKSFSILLTAILICLLGLGTLNAQIPRTLSYQGVLADNIGKPRPDGNHTFKFCLYGSNSDGSPMWCEEKTLPVKNGLFFTTLGDKTPFGAAVKFDQQYWLGIQVGNEPELAPRIALTSVGYSLSSLRADTAKIAMASIRSSSDTTWRSSGGNVYLLNGNVGIGTTSPQDKLNVAGDQISVSQAIASDSKYDWLVIRSNRPDNDYGGINAGYAKIYLVTPGTTTTGESNNHTFGDIRIAMKESGESTVMNDRLTIRSNGSVGIGTTTPTSKLDVVGKIKMSDGGAGWVVQEQQVSGQYHFNVGDLNNAGSPTRMAIDHNGNVGIGTATPTRKLDVVGEIKMSGSGRGWLMEEHPVSGQHHFNIADLNIAGNPSRLTIDHNGNVGIGTTTPSTALDVAGTTTTKVIAITGGSDLAEPFEISESQPIPKGALVIIDEENPGQLKLSHQAYDKRVAGVVSGAGGINPGLTLTQEGVLEGGQNVALSGRVYALATAANGPIKPGDLLTTSDIPGHAMKATDFVRWQGAVIGKAMSSLEEGEGLVLVLVNLQ
jgi:hypothetical protein